MRADEPTDAEEQLADGPTPVLAGQLDALELLPDWH